MTSKDPAELKFLTLAEVAKAFGVSVNTVYAWTLKGCPTSLKEGKFMLRLKDVIAWRRSQQ